VDKLGEMSPVPNIFDPLAFSLAYLEKLLAGDESLSERSACGPAMCLELPVLTAEGLGACPPLFPMAFSYLEKSLDFCQGWNFMP